MTGSADAWRAVALMLRAEAEAMADAIFDDGLAETASAHETDEGWCVELMFETRPDTDALPSADWRVEPMRQEDWVTKSLAGLHPVRAGRFVVHGSHDRARLPGGAIGIEVEAGLAFGTGHHGTTWGCLVALDRLLRRARPERALDLGCGSGVLAIALAKATPGGPTILASDIDADSVVVARENAKLNAVPHRLHVVEATGLNHPALRGGGPYDLVMANILAGPLRAMAPEIAPSIAHGGTLILSGLLAHQEPMVRNTYHAHGFTHLFRVPNHGWMTLVLRRT